jgi:hypothetical protein
LNHDGEPVRVPEQMVEYLRGEGEGLERVRNKPAPEGG